MAWVGIGALLGLAICGLWWLSSIVRDRAERAEQATGRRSRGSRSPLVALLAIGVVAVLLAGVVVFLAAIDLRGAGSDGSTSSASTTSPTSPGVRRPPPASVQLLVENGSGFAKPASDVAGVLRRMGYTVTGTITVPARATSAVQCRDQYASDALWLVYLLGPSVSNDVFPDPAPPEAASAGCIVIVGREL